MRIAHKAVTERVSFGSMGQRSSRSRERSAYLAHPLADLKHLYQATRLRELLASTPLARMLRGAEIQTDSWVLSALLQQLYGIDDDDRWMEALRFNTLYRWFVGLEQGATTCWSAREHRRAWTRMLSDRALREAFRRLVIDGRQIVPIPPPSMRRDLALIECVSDSAPRKKMPRPASAAEHPLNRRLRHATIVFNDAVSLIRKRIGDPSLNGAKLASALHISRRTLYYAFESRGFAPCTVIKEERLDRCMKALTDPSLVDVKIITIAIEFGYRDVSTFCRQFKARYGLAPSAMRSAEPARGSCARKREANVGCLA